MLKFDESKLRAQVNRDFDSFAHGITDAEAMKAFVDTVMANAIGAVRDMLSEANDASFMGRIPPEILAACFAHLPFRFRMPVSHVCRYWRAAALSAPELWSDIAPCIPCNSPDLIRLALSRAGSRPIHLRVDARAPHAPQAMYDAIAPFSRQLRYIAWCSEQPFSFWDFPAPNMECFWSSTTMFIDDDFLGGQPGRLRYLYLSDSVDLPLACPALSTVTDLSVASTALDDESPSDLENLFDLLPRLEYLHITGITQLAATMLPSGRAPESLKELWLQSRSWDCDLMPHYLAWDSGNLQHVSLTQYPGVHPNLERMANGTVRLAIKHVSNRFATCLMFEHTATKSHLVSVHQLGLDHAVALLVDVQSHLSNVHTAMVSHVALGPLDGLLTALPKLEHLFVHITPRHEPGSDRRPRPYIFAWTYLFWLSHLAAAARELRAITLHVWSGEDSNPPFVDAYHARELVSQLRALSGTLPPIEVQGFLVDQLETLDLTGLDIRFNVSAEVGDLILHKGRNAYDPLVSEWMEA